MDEIQGLVLDSLDYKEKSKIVYLYTPLGHDTVKANRCKDTKMGLLAFTTTLNEVSYIKTASKFPTLIEYSLIQTNYSLTTSIEVMKSVSIMMYVIKNIPNDSDHKRAYNFIISMLHQIASENHKKVLSIFMIKMLYIFGVNPQLKQCVSCGSVKPEVFSISHGGGLCMNCSTAKQTSTFSAWKEYYFDKKKIEQYSDTNYDVLLDEIVLYYSRYVNINFKNK